MHARTYVIATLPHYKSANVYSLNHKERLVKPPSDRSQRKEDDTAEYGKGRNARRFFLGTENGKAVLNVIADPETTMDGSGEEHDAACHAMKKIEPFIAVAGSKKERQKGVFGGKEEYNRELGECEEAWMKKEWPRA